MSVPTVRVLTEANQREMQRQLEELAACHKKAKLQELFERQDELRPYDPSITPKSKHMTAHSQARDQSDEEIKAMKSQFTDLHRKQLNKQISKQFSLRMDEQNEKKPSTGYGSDGSGEIKVDDKDVAAMKEDFNKQQKLILKTQIEKSFRLRDQYQKERLMDDETEEKLIEDSEDMKMQFQELNKTLVRLRSTKTLEMGMNPQIKPKHKEQFNLLMRDIGIVNEHIMDELWANIEKTVHDDEDEEDDEEDKDNIIHRLQKENGILHEEMQRMQQELSVLKEMATVQLDSDDDEMWIVN